jgi:site-specific DNA recombinase
MTSDHKIACALVRVSSEEQARGGYGLEFQEQDIRAFCARNNFELARVFRDEGYSGATAERPGFKEMMEWARSKRFDVLVIWKLDRLFRDTKLTLQTVDELASLDIEVRSVQETFTHDSNGRFLLTIFAAGAEKERRDIALRMHSGRLASARRGTWVAGGGTPPYGYRYDPSTKRLVIVEQEAAVVRNLFKWLIEEKLSLYKIQARMNDLRIPTKFDLLGRKKNQGHSHWWAKRTIGRIVSNEVYQGTFTFRKYTKLGSVRGKRNLRPKEDWVSVKTPQIISEATFAKAAEQLRHNSANSPRRTKTLFLLRGLLLCGHDNRRIQAARRLSDRGGECKYYFCSGTRKSVTSVLCPSRSVSESRVVPPVWDKLTELLTNPALVLDEIRRYRERAINPRNVADQIQQLEARKSALDQRKRRLVELYIEGSVDKGRFRAESLKLRLEMDRVDRETEEARSTLVTTEETRARASTVREVYEKYKDRLSQASDQVKRELLTLFVNNIVIRDDDLVIQVNLPDGGLSGTIDSAVVPQRKVPIFLRARLRSVSEVFRQKELQKNFSRPSRQEQ